MTNSDRMRQLRTIRRAPRFQLGADVREPHGDVGVIDSIYADLAAAIDGGVVSAAWYELQRKTPTTPKDGVWYGVILAQGSVLAGELDLVEIQ